MKTFLEFIAEAEVRWNTGRIKGGTQSPSSVANQKMKNLVDKLTRTPNLNASEKKGLEDRIRKMRPAIKGATQLAKERDPLPQGEWNKRENRRGKRPSQEGDTRGPSGSLPSIPSSAGEGEGISVGSRYADIRGRTSPFRNNNISRTGGRESGNR
jgi:hypothetical protein